MWHLRGVGRGTRPRSVVAGWLALSSLSRRWALWGLCPFGLGGSPYPTPPPVCPPPGQRPAPQGSGPLLSFLCLLPGAGAHSPRPSRPGSSPTCLLPQSPFTVGLVGAGRPRVLAGHCALKMASGKLLARQRVQSQDWSLRQHSEGPVWHRARKVPVCFHGPMSGRSSRGGRPSPGDFTGRLPGLERGFATTVSGV